MSNTRAISAAVIVTEASWLIEENSDNKRGISDTIITKVVLITAWNVFSLQCFIDSFIDLFLFLLTLNAEIICTESSTINPKTIAKIKALDKLI